ncbi:hypothetical protein PC116_g30589 [Phytophthora cactorum]|nr:hypothetical protein PC116_g30589 [Phytophthora cactorum]
MNQENSDLELSPGYSPGGMTPRLHGSPVYPSQWSLCATHTIVLLSALATVAAWRRPVWLALVNRFVSLSAARNAGLGSIPLAQATPSARSTIPVSSHPVGYLRR